MSKPRDSARTAAAREEFIRANSFKFLSLEEMQKQSSGVDPDRVAELYKLTIDMVNKKAFGLPFPQLQEPSQPSLISGMINGLSDRLLGTNYAAENNKAHSEYELMHSLNHYTNVEDMSRRGVEEAFDRQQSESGERLQSLKTLTGKSREQLESIRRDLNERGSKEADVTDGNSGKGVNAPSTPSGRNL